MNSMIKLVLTGSARWWARCIGAAVFLLAGCDGVSGPAPEANPEAHTGVSMRMPAMVSRAVDSSQVTVDVLVNGVEVNMMRDGEQFTGTALQPAGSEPLVSIIWYEFFNDQRLRLAWFEQRLQSLDSHMTLAIDETMYETAGIDADGDTISNLSERTDGTDPFDPADPGLSNDGSPVATGNVGNSEIDVLGDPFLTQMMTTESDTDPLPMFSDAWWSANQSQTELSSIDSLKAATSEGRGDILTFEQGADFILSRTWANRRSDHAAPQSELQVTGLYAEVLDKRDEQWKRVWGPLTIGGANQWAEEWLGQASDSPGRGSNIAGGPIAAFSHDIDETGLAAPQTGFPWSVEGQVSADLVQNAKVYRVRGLVRVAMRPDATADDRNSASFLIQQTFELMNSAHPAYPYNELTPGSEFTRPNATYPGSAVFGGKARWYRVPYQSDYPEKWYAFGVISITDSVWPASIGNPWSGAIGCEEWECESPHATVGGLSSAQYELSSPPAIGF